MSEGDRRETLPGSPAGSDLFEPHMPDVDRPPDLAAVFTTARAAGDSPEVHIVTPGRMIMRIPAPRGMPDSALAGARELLKSAAPLDVAVISYTRLEAIMADENRTKCIPFLGHLLGFAAAGHRVVVFEGHPSAFEVGVAGADLLLVDSGMVPFLQPDWAEAAFRLMKPGARLLLHDRASYALMELPPGGGTGPDGHMAYINRLLTTVAETHKSIVLTAGKSLPDLATLTDDERARAWIAEMPADRASLSSGRVIALVLSSAKPEGLFRRRMVLRASVAHEAGSARAVAFKLTSGLDGERNDTLTIEPL
jgi:hypothetical protein